MATRPSDPQIADMEADLRRSWGTLSCRSKDAMDFWSHEWSRHGTCSGMPQHAYFRAALDLKARLDLTGALLDAGIVPSDEAEYCLGRVRDAVAAATGGAVMVECNRSKRNQGFSYRPVWPETGRYQSKSNLNFKFAVQTVPTGIPVGLTGNRPNSIFFFFGLNLNAHKVY